MMKTILTLFCCFFISGLSATPKLFIGIAGGTASGKTTFGKKLQEAFPKQSILIHMDDYYNDFSHLSQEEAESINFDHPSALNIKLFHQHLLELKQGRSIVPPSYDFISHASTPSTLIHNPAEIIIVEGMLLFSVPELRELFDIKIFIDIDRDVRLLRRIERDIRERGFTLESSEKQYLNITKPMHELFVEPTKQYADIIVPKGGQNQIAFNIVSSQLWNYTTHKK